MKVVHISDTHGSRYIKNLVIPECDVLIHSGDFTEYRNSVPDLTEFLIWFEQQPAKVKLFIGGNHDLVLDRKWCSDRTDTVASMIATQQHHDAIKLINNYKVKYLNNTEYVYEGIKFWGSPYSPSFGHDWAFNANPGEDIMKHWAKIPSDVNILITHTPVYRFLDAIEEEYMREGEIDEHKGCKDLLNVIQKRLFKLKLHCCGHIHDAIGVVLGRVSNTRRVLFSNASTISNKGEQRITNPLIITI